MAMYIGEALAGDGNEIAHIDLLIGSKDGPVGIAFANALARQSEGHSNLLAVLTPNLAVKPSTVMVTKVTIKGATQAVQQLIRTRERRAHCTGRTNAGTNPRAVTQVRVDCQALPDRSDGAAGTNVKATGTAGDPAFAVRT